MLLLILGVYLMSTRLTIFNFQIKLQIEPKILKMNGITYEKIYIFFFVMYYSGH